MKNNIKDKIINELIDLELPLGNSFNYWVDLLLAIYEDKFDKTSMSDYYYYLAVKNNSTISRIERVLRYGTEKMKPKIRKKYNIKTDITNQSITILFKLKVF